MDEFDFGEWLLDEMEKRGWTCYRLAQITGMSPVSIGYYLTFKRSPTLTSLKLILDAFGKHIEIKDNKKIADNT